MKNQKKSNFKQEEDEDKSLIKIVKFSDLGISDSILEILRNLNLEIPTPIQQETIPIALSGQDLIGVAQTGTGKTFAFGIPMLQRLGLTQGQGLVIAPTRELANQVEESLKKIGLGLGLRTALLIGGEAIERQLFSLRRKPHIIVATPGRLIDHLKRRTIKLDKINIIVIDEGDMMLDMGFAPQIEEILKQAPTERQTMLFSATMPTAIVKIAAKYMKMPINIQVAPPGTTATEVDQEIFMIRGEERFDHLLKTVTYYTGSVLVFVRTKHGVKNVNMKLRALGQRSDEIHSNLSLSRRRSALDGFKTKKIRILVATDVAARGLDINGIELVINYNLPDNCEDYVHRIGRTGRAGQTGKAITFATFDDHRSIRDIEKLINKNIKRTEFVKPKFIQTTISKPTFSKSSFAKHQPARSDNGSFAGGTKNNFSAKNQEPKPFFRSSRSARPLFNETGNKPISFGRARMRPSQSVPEISQVSSKTRQNRLKNNSTHINLKNHKSNRNKKQFAQ